MTAEQVIEQIKALPSKDLPKILEFVQSIEDEKWCAWDEQIARDITSAKFDEMLQRVDRDIESNRTIRLR